MYGNPVVVPDPKSRMCRRVLWCDCKPLTLSHEKCKWLPKIPKKSSLKTSLHVNKPWTKSLPSLLDIFMMREMVLTAASLALTGAVVANAYYQKHQFYPSVVYLTKSSPSMAVSYLFTFFLPPILLFITFIVHSDVFISIYYVYSTRFNDIMNVFCHSCRFFICKPLSLSFYWANSFVKYFLANFELQKWK